MWIFSRRYESFNMWPFFRRYHVILINIIFVHSSNQSNAMLEGFPIAIPLRAIMRNCAQFLGVYRARNCAQVKSTCVGNPKCWVLHFQRAIVFLIIEGYDQLKEMLQRKIDIHHVVQPVQHVPYMHSVVLASLDYLVSSWPNMFMQET